MARHTPAEKFNRALERQLSTPKALFTALEPGEIRAASATPYLSVRNAAAALEFYKKAFGAIEVMRLMQPDGRVGHAQIDIEGARIMLADAFPEFGFKTPESLGGSSVH